MSRLPSKTKLIKIYSVIRSLDEKGVVRNYSFLNVMHCITYRNNRRYLLYFAEYEKRVLKSFC